MSDPASVIREHFRPTPLVAAPSLSVDGSRVYLKNETVLPTGSFKVRGAVYSLARRRARGPVAEVVAASTGNHGAAVAWAAALNSTRATIFLPAHHNEVKAGRISALGARIVATGADLSGAIDAAREYAARTNAFFLHDAADPDVPVGAGTIGLEIVDELPSTDTIVVPMGDTALVRGVAGAAKSRNPSVRIVGVIAERAPAYYQSWHSGVAEHTDTADTIADGLAVTRALPENVDTIRALVDEVRLVGEHELLHAIWWLHAREGIVAEPAGAAATAAFLQARPTGATVLLVTGGNIAPEILASAAALGASGR